MKLNYEALLARVETATKRTTKRTLWSKVKYYLKNGERQNYIQYVSGLGDTGILRISRGKEWHSLCDFKKVMGTGGKMTIEITSLAFPLREVLTVQQANSIEAALADCAMSFYTSIQNEKEQSHVKKLNGLIHVGEL